ncbi:DUF1934 domain-containing protein [Sporolactobacillus sp. Y61]|uniref:DUF1934 domain-containing protein n=1 Tax=Sporolactobacillus sp. Y61 TaxID=3160863 RepID=A0AAU8II26_9BACL
MTSQEIEIEWVSRIPGSRSPLRMSLRGRLKEGTDGFYLTYRAEGASQYIIKFTKGEALIRRRGQYPLRQPLKLGKSLHGKLGTPSGNLATEAAAESITATWSPESGSGAAGLVYRLNIQGEDAGTFRITWSFMRL